ncbi:tRNA lysidine(34) synthetase TilS [Xylophilus sp. Kf1]|nr:tRNA lysidine(34) synthetase TilS [Xylophilus sp. Kf1]
MTTVFTDPVAAAVAGMSPVFPLAVALSGGADSTTLLAACARRWPGQVRAVHVHHGLQAAADRFVVHCQDLCVRLDVPLTVLRVDARPAAGDSPEDAARRARYQALDAYARADGVASIALAQHADDQVETVLLALSRGAGLAGLAGMPGRWQRGEVCFLRPLLGVGAQAIRDAARAQDLQWVEDPSNLDENFTRNRIRARILPVLEAAFPQFRRTFARSARHAAEAQAVLDEVAAADLLATGSPPRLAALQALSAGRQALVVRRWLRSSHGTTPEAAQLAELLRQVAACTTRGHRIRIKVGNGFVVREGPILGWYNSAFLPTDAGG